MAGLSISGQKKTKPSDPAGIPRFYRTGEKIFVTTGEYRAPKAKEWFVGGLASWPMQAHGQHDPNEDLDWRWILRDLSDLPKGAPKIVIEGSPTARDNDGVSLGGRYFVATGEKRRLKDGEPFYWENGRKAGWSHDAPPGSLSTDPVWILQEVLDGGA